MISWAEIQSILKTLLRWWWIILLAVALACGTAFVLSARETRYYRARAVLQIGNTFDQPVPDERQIILSSSLARFYSEIARRKPILEKIVTKLQLPFDWEVISDVMLQTAVVPSASLLEISITDSNPDRAAAIANAIADELIAYSPSSPDKIAAEQAAVERQIEDSNKRIEEFNRQIAELDEQRANTTSASDLAEINNKLAALNVSLQNEQETYRSLVLLKGRSDVNVLLYYERAEPPTTPLPSRRIVTIAVAGVAGLLLAFMTIFVLDKLDTRWRGPRDVSDRFGLADLGLVPIGPPVIVADGEFAIKRERAIRDAHTNILLAASETQLRGLLVSSPQPSADRSALSLDLACVFARAGHRVLLVDADLENPTLTQILAPAGLAEPPADAPEHRADLRAHLRQTVIPNITLLPGKANGLNGLPALVPSLRWPELVRQLLTAADIVIFDGPSALSSADAALLAPHVDGAVLAIAPHVDSREDVDRSKQRLRHNPAARLLGAVTMKVIGAAQKGEQKLLNDLAPLALPPGRPQPAGYEQPYDEPAQGPRQTIVTPIYNPEEEADEPITQVVMVEGEEQDAAPQAPASAPQPHRNGTAAHHARAATGGVSKRRQRGASRTRKTNKAAE